MGKINYSIIRQEVGKIIFQQLKLDHFTSNMWETFRGQLIRVLCRHVPMRRADEDDKVRETWMTKDVIKNFLTKKKGAN